MDQEQEMVNEFFAEQNEMIKNNRMRLELLRQIEAADDDEGDIRQQIVDLMPNYPVLWNTQLRSFKDLTKKDAAWKEISNQINNVSSEY